MKIVFQLWMCDFRLLPVCDKGKSSPRAVASVNVAECVQGLLGLSKFAGFRSTFSFHILSSHLELPTFSCVF